VAADGRRLLCGLCGGQITSGPGYVRVEDCPVHIRCFAAQFGRSDEVETLLTSLRDSPTDSTGDSAVASPAQDHLFITAPD
jgi:hypothetical protein